MNKILIYLICVMASINVGCTACAGQNEDKTIVVPDSVYSYENMMNDLDALKKKYSLILCATDEPVLGKSVEGRDIPAVKLGRGRHKILVCATLHAREYITTNYIMYFIEKYAKAYCKNDTIGKYNVRELLDNVTFYIVPMVNPDGVNIVQNGFEKSQFKDSLEKMCYRDCIEPVHRSWKSNAKGVDINRNFDYGWSRKDECLEPGSSGYNGPEPLSEPETKALADFAKQVKPEAVVAFHTQGEMLYLSEPDDVAKSIAQKLLESTNFTKEPIDPPYGSFQDFVDYHFNVFYACVELCPYVGPFPYDEDKFYEVWNRAQYVLPIVASELIANEK